MARIKYYYDTETCKYERLKVSKWDVLLNLLGFFAVSLVLATGLILVGYTYFDSPKEALLRKENQELQFHYELVQKEMKDVGDMMAVLQKRDDNIYRTIMEVDAIPPSIRRAGIGGSKRYKDLLEKDLEREELVVETFGNIDQLRKQMYIQTKSYDEIMELVKNKSIMLASMPAIQPITNEELTRLASGFGMRIHPMLKVRKMHTGIDYSAVRGTPIYSTGDGKVIRVKTNHSGYGKEVEIDHGFGFVTKYAHMNMFNVKKGQKVHRGDVIGYVGSTGSSTAPHLHYEIIKDGKKVNPIHYVYKGITADEYEKLSQLASVENQSLE